MTNQTQSRQAKATDAARTFFYNIIIPDAAILVFGLTTSFAATLSIFS